MRRILEGYLLIAKQSGDLLSAVIIDLPAWLCLVGRLDQGGDNQSTRYYLQTLDKGRDSYLPEGIAAPQSAQRSPTLTAGAFNSIPVGVSGSNFVPTRYWGLAQPFNGVGATHSFSAVSTIAQRWPMSYAGTDDEFAWRVVVIAPTTVRFADSAVIPDNPTSPVASWTLDIGESVLGEVGATAITRLLDQPAENFELNWEAAQYPWIATDRPLAFTDDEGNLGYRITVAAQVIYEPAGPYYWSDEENPPQVGPGVWSEVSNGYQQSGGVPSGARGIWAADIEIIGESARIIDSYKIFGGDPDREPLLRDRTGNDGVVGTWYLNNIVYRAPMSSLRNEDGSKTTVLLCSTFVDRTPDIFESPDGSAFEFVGKLFLDLHWFEAGVQRTQNLKEIDLKRGVYHPGFIAPPYWGANAAWDIGDADEGRFTIGSDTDGTVAVFPVFSFFEPGQFPILDVFVASRDGVRVGFSGAAGFYMCVACGTGEQAMVNYGVVENSETPSDDILGKWISLPAGFDQVTYIGNQRYAFYVSTVISDRADDNYMYAPAGNIAIATYSAATDVIRVEGVIDQALTTTGFGGDGPIDAQTAYQYVNQQAYTVPVFASPPKLGRIEVVRSESDGYNPADPSLGGHPATLIASKGFGQPGLNLEEFDGQDITQGVTWISYDSGATWAKILDYGSPAGIYHCGNIAQARTEPVVRV